MPPRTQSPGLALVPVRIDAQNHLIGLDRIVPLQIYHVRDGHPRSPSPWSREADKVAWTDQARVPPVSFSIPGSAGRG